MSLLASAYLPWCLLTSLICLYMSAHMHVCVRACVCRQVFCSSPRLDARPNAFRRCLFNQNLGLHGKANRKQAALFGKARASGWVRVVEAMVRWRREV